MAVPARTPPWQRGSRLRRRRELGSVAVQVMVQTAAGGVVHHCRDRGFVHRVGVPSGLLGRCRGVWGPEVVRVLKSVVRVG
jgi:hypothetical protein